jgi:hypothetical protein
MSYKQSLYEMLESGEKMANVSIVLTCKLICTVNGNVFISYFMYVIG